MFGRAHGTSLPLFAVLQQVEGLEIEAATERLNATIQRLLLQEHVDVVLLLQEGAMSVDLESKSEFGKAVLQQLQERMMVIACPPGDCDYNAAGACRWCGEMKV